MENYGTATANTQSAFGELIQRFNNLNGDNEKFLSQMINMQERLQPTPPQPISDPSNSIKEEQGNYGLISQFQKCLDQYSYLIMKYEEVFQKVNKII